MRFQARLSESLPWTVTVADATGNVVASGTGESQAIDWTWDAATAVPGSYSWTISAGDTVRAASGSIGAKAVDARDHVGDRTSAHDHAERRRADGLQPDLLHAQRAGDRDRNTARARRDATSRCSSLSRRGPGSNRSGSPQRESRTDATRSCSARTTGGVTVNSVVSRSRRSHRAELRRRTGRGLTQR